MMSAFFHPAYTATILEITPTELLPSANSLTSLTQRATSTIGPSIGASIVAFGLDAPSFAISAGYILVILRTSSKLASSPASSNSTPEPVVSDPPTGNLGSALKNLKEGYLAVIAPPWLWITIVIFGFINATSNPMSVSLPLLIESNLNGNVTVLGFFDSMSAIGFVVGTLGMGSLKKIRNRGWLAYIDTFLAGLMICVFGLVTSIPVLAAAAFFDGHYISIFSLVWTNTLQELVSRDKLGRVASMDALGSYVLLPIGYGISGWATDLIGAPVVFVIGGGLTAFLALIGLSNRSIRGLN